MKRLLALTPLLALVLLTAPGCGAPELKAGVYAVEQGTTELRREHWDWTLEKHQRGELTHLEASGRHAYHKNFEDAVTDAKEKTRSWFVPASAATAVAESLEKTLSPIVVDYEKLLVEKRTRGDLNDRDVQIRKNTVTRYRELIAAIRGIARPGFLDRPTIPIPPAPAEKLPFSILR